MCPFVASVICVLSYYVGILMLSCGVFGILMLSCGVCVECIDVELWRVFGVLMLSCGVCSVY